MRPKLSISCYLAEFGKMMKKLLICMTQCHLCQLISKYQLINHQITFSFLKQTKLVKLRICHQCKKCRNVYPQISNLIKIPIKFIIKKKNSYLEILSIHHFTGILQKNKNIYTKDQQGSKKILQTKLIQSMSEGLKVIQILYSKCFILITST